MSTQAETAPPGLRSLPRKQVILTFAGVMMAMFLSSLDQTVVGTAMPKIISDLGGFSHYTWVTTAYIITSAVSIPITGKLIDMYGRRGFYIFGLVLFTVASALCGFSNTLTQIILFRGIQGVGAGIMMANAFTAIGDLFPPAERGKYQGFMSGVFGLSSIIGPALGGYITDALSWHWVFFVNVPLGILIILLFFLFFPKNKPDALRHAIDYPGLTTFILAVVPAMLAISWAGVDFPWGSPLIIGMFVFSAVMTALFIFFENRSAEPILPLNLFKDRIVAVSEVVIFLTGMGMFGGIVFIPLFFQGVLGLPAVTSGSFLTPMMLGMITGSFVSGQMLSRAGGHYRLLGAIGIFIMGGGMALLSTMGAATTYGTAIRNIVVTGFGMGVTMPLYIIAIQNAVPYSRLGVATSSGAFFRSIGGSVGLAIFGSVMNNRFASELFARIPDSIKAVVPPEQLSALAQNPQALLNPEAQSQLRGLMDSASLPGAPGFEQLLLVMQQALSSSLSRVFLISLLILAVAFIVNFFIKEIPLRKYYKLDDSPVPQEPGRKPE